MDYNKELQEQNKLNWTESRDNLAAVKFILHGIIDKKLQEDPATYFEAVKKVPEHTHYKAVDLIVARTETGLTFTAGTLIGKTQSMAVTFETIKEIIDNQYIMSL